MRTSISALRSSQRGFALIEVVASAALLLVVAVGVLAGIDGPSAISANNKAHSTSADLAQQDQERMRALPVSQLLGYSETRTVAVAGVNYTVFSKVSWVRDAAGDTDTSCTSAPDDENSGDYLKLTSRVSSKASRRPVQLDSLLAPPPGTAGSATGNLSVQIKNHVDAPVIDLPVTINGPVGQTVNTNDAGCAFFGPIPTGSYQVTFSRAGWVDPTGVNAVSLTSSVTAGSTNVVNHLYAQAASISVTIETRVNGVTQPSNSTAVTVANGSLPAGTLTFPISPAASARTVTNLFPFPSGYGVWSGGCVSGNPAANGQPAVVATPGAGGSASVTVREPAINPAVTGVTIPPGARFVATSTSSGCTEKFIQTVNAQSKLPDPGHPYGQYKLCGDYSGVYADLATFLNNDPNGKTATLTYRGNGTCP
jgi:type II secretory pathway pseudopilin PulG